MTTSLSATSLNLHGVGNPRYARTAATAAEDVMPNESTDYLDNIISGIRALETAARDLRLARETGFPHDAELEARLGKLKRRVLEINSDLQNVFENWPASR